MVELLGRQDLNAELDEAGKQQQALNVQLMNLINANKALQEHNTALQAEQEGLRAKLEEASAAQASAQEKLDAGRDEGVQLRARVERQAMALVKGEVEVARVAVAAAAATCPSTRSSCRR